MSAHLVEVTESYWRLFHPRQETYFWHSCDFARHLGAHPPEREFGLYRMTWNVLTARFEYEKVANIDGDFEE